MAYAADPDIQAERGVSRSRGAWGNPTRVVVGVTPFKGGLLTWVISSQRVRLGV